MKHFLTALSVLFLSGALNAQLIITLTPEEYAVRKAARTLAMDTVYTISEVPGTKQSAAINARQAPASPSVQSTTCNCLMPLDTSFDVVPFAFGIAPDYRNDDFSTGTVALPFQFNFFGVLYDSIFINNNGNISFGAPYGTFTASSFPSSTYSMIAPFWGDVDTRDSASGLVYYKIMPGYVVIRWDSVGYYSQHSDKRNTFQLIITDGTDTIIPTGQNVSFCYGDMEWTTGDASGGINGYGGTASTTGVNYGNGTDYFQVTRSVDSTSNFDGPYATDDGIDWLDNMQIGFNTTINGNVPPLVMNNTLCDTIDVFTGDTLRTMAIDSIVFDFFFMTPETNQSLVATITTNSPGNPLSVIQILNTPQAQAFRCIFDARDLPPGFYTVTATATDNGVPALQSSSSVYIQTIFDPSIHVADQLSSDAITVYPNPAVNTLTVTHPVNAVRLLMTDVNGALVKSETTTGQRTEIATEHLNAGVYFIHVIGENGSSTVIKFLKY